MAMDMSGGELPETVEPVGAHPEGPALDGPPTGRTAEDAEDDGSAPERRVHDLEARVAGLEQDLAEALSKYRAAALAAAPDLPEELVSGRTIAELDESLARARAVVERLRERMMEADASSPAVQGRVPAGAPPRRPPDLSRLSAREKIALGLERL